MTTREVYVAFASGGPEEGTPIRFEARGRRGGKAPGHFLPNPAHVTGGAARTTFVYAKRTPDTVRVAMIATK